MLEKARSELQRKEEQLKEKKGERRREEEEREKSIRELRTSLQTKEQLVQVRNRQTLTHACAHTPHSHTTSLIHSRPNTHCPCLSGVLRVFGPTAGAQGEEGHSPHQTERSHQGQRQSTGGESHRLGENEPQREHITDIRGGQSSS